MAAPPPNLTQNLDEDEFQIAEGDDYSTSKKEREKKKKKRRASEDETFLRHGIDDGATANKRPRPSAASDSKELVPSARHSLSHETHDETVTNKRRKLGVGSRSKEPNHSVQLHRRGKPNKKRKRSSSRKTNKRS
ncbi:hypothetical protein MMC10_007135 [Thelotrema lepadinum]|nr:hypothetical protein [Thelotrema lepadinum]